MLASKRFKRVTILRLVISSFHVLLLVIININFVNIQKHLINGAKARIKYVYKENAVAATAATTMITTTATITAGIL